MIFHPHAIAYLDILGFSQFVVETETEPDKMRCLDKLFNEVIPREVSDQGKNIAFPNDLGMKCLSCSDSIVISAPVTEKAPYPPMVAVSMKAIQVAHSLIDMGFLVRGAISQGNVYRTDSNILGTGFLEAVNAEKKAGNPKIVLTASAKKALNELIEKGYPRYSIYAKDELEQIILNSIHPFQDYFPNKYGAPDNYFNKYRDTIMENLSNGKLDEKARQKWLWTAGLFNSNNKIFSSLTSLEPPPTIQTNEALPTIIVNYLNPLDPDWMNDCKAPGVRLTLQYPKNRFHATERRDPD